MYIFTYIYIYIYIERERETRLKSITSTVPHSPTENLISRRAAYRNIKGEMTFQLVIVLKRPGYGPPPAQSHTLTQGTVFRVEPPIGTGKGRRPSHWL